MPIMQITNEDCDDEYYRVYLKLLRKESVVGESSATIKKVLADNPQWGTPKQPQTNYLWLFVLIGVVLIGVVLIKFAIIFMPVVLIGGLIGLLAALDQH